MNTFSKKGFYIYDNFCYSFVFTDNEKTFGRILKIFNDTISITSSFNNATAMRRNIDYDTLKYSINNIKTLQLITEGIDGYAKDIDMSEYNLELVKSNCCTETSKAIYRQDPQLYTKSDTLVRFKKYSITLESTKMAGGSEKITDCYPYLTNNGVAFIYENGGLIYIVNSWAPGK